VDGLKALDPNRPIREADIFGAAKRLRIASSATAKMVEAVELVSYGTDIFDIVTNRRLIDHG
jgi:hypothetical protein